MVTDYLGLLLQELSPLLKIKDLHPDKNNTCLIKFVSGVEIYLEMINNGEWLLIGCNLGHVPPGRYRVDLFREALKSNSLPLPQYGTFAYSKQSDCLVLFHRMHQKQVSAEAVADFLNSFLEKAAKWKEAITRGEIPVISATYMSGMRQGMFGLRP